MTARSPVGLVTGAASAAGVAFARELAARGARLLLVTAEPGLVTELVRELGVEGAQLSVLAVDLASRIDSGGLVDIIRQRGPLDYLVNIAERGEEPREGRPDYEHQLVDARIHGMLAVTRAALAGMLAHGRGVVVNVAMAPALLPKPGLAVSGATQAFLMHYSLALRQEVADAGIDVRCLYLGHDHDPQATGAMGNLRQLAALALAADGSGWIAAEGSSALAEAQRWWCDSQQPL